MKKQYKSYICTLILAFLCSIGGKQVLKSNTSVFYYYETSWIYRMANHYIMGIILGFIGFILFFGLLFHTAHFILVRFNRIYSFLNILCLIWLILLMIAFIHQGITLYYILGYSFLLFVLIFFLLLIIHYFHPNT